MKRIHEQKYRTQKSQKFLAKYQKLKTYISFFLFLSLIFFDLGPRRKIHI